MLPFRKILFPTDYSEPCKASLPYVREMTRHYGAELTVLHAYRAFHSDYGEIIGVNTPFAQRIHALEVENLRKFAADAFPSQHVELRVVEGEPGSAIRNFVEHEGTDLVMLPTRGQGPMRRLLIGSTTAKVLHDISAAVWTAPGSAFSETAEHQPNPHCRSIVCALDNTDEAEVVLAAAAGIASSYGARLFLHHAVAVPPMAMEIDFAACLRAAEDGADCALRSLKDKLGIKAPHTITSGLMLDGVLKEVVEREADLLVLGRGESQGAVSRIWSNLYPLVRESPCPVLSI